jgi:M6 family metalloprotease-like protein
VSGTRKVIFLLLEFSDDTAVPHQPAFYTDMTNPLTPPAGEVFPATINGFFTKTSWNKFSWVGDVGGVGGVGASVWLTLPQPKSYYAPCGWDSSCANLQQLGDDGTALGRAQGIVFTNYDNINFVLSNDLDCCAWGGTYYSSVDNKTYGATWEPPWGQETGTYSHEMGHSIGLPHSGWVYYSYDSPWDVMSDRTSANTVVCGSYFSINDNGTDDVLCTEPGDGYIAPHKDYLGWIPSANLVTTDTNSSVTVNLEADSLPLSSAMKMIKICKVGVSCSGTTAHYLTVEARVTGLGTNSQYDNGLPGEGIIIHDFQADRSPISGPCFFNDQSGWALPIDSTPGDYDSVNCNFGGRTYPNYALFNAQWSPGQTYTNSTYGVAVTILSRTGSTFVVSVGPMKRRGQLISE